MLLQMNEVQIKTVKGIEHFLLGTTSTLMSLKAEQQGLFIIS